MIVCIGLPWPLVGSAGWSGVVSADQYGAANVNVGGAGTTSPRYASLASPTALAKLARTERSICTRHAPVGRPMTLVSTAIRSCAPWHRQSRPRYGDAHVSFLVGRGKAQMGMLDGKVAIVTGSGNGVGRGEAIMLADHGAKVVVNDLGGSVTGEGADKRAADEVVDVIKKRGGDAAANYDSVADFEGARNIVATAVEAFGRLDILVNNAGVLRDRMMFSMPPEDFDKVVKVHLYGTFNTMHHASVYWRNEAKEGRQPRASIVNTVSSAGLQGQASQINYGAAKAGIAAMTIIASLELKRYGVRANCIGPGGATRMVAQAMKIEVKNAEDYTEFDAMNPGNSAPAVVWLASDEALHVTGQVFRLVGNNLALYRPWEMGEQFLATDKEGNPKQWDPADIGRILNRYAFGSEAPGIDAQRRS